VTPENQSSCIKSKKKKKNIPHYSQGCLENACRLFVGLQASGGKHYNTLNAMEGTL
jgi:hypothetical protein